MTEPSGVIILDKPAGYTSHDCVNKLRRFFNTKKVGHTGTLDPMATGVLPILIGRAAKAADLLLAEDKVYLAGLRLGITTDTEDISGQILTESSEIPTQREVERVCAAFIGDSMQIPPMYSALKVNGQKLVDLARSGIVIEREPRPISISRLELSNTDRADEYTVRVACSKGTYIRTLCADIGAALGCGGAMSSLRREQSGGFALADAVTLDRLESMTLDERLSLLRPVESLFAELPKITLPPFFEKLARSGCEIYLSKLKLAYPAATRVRLHGSTGFFALGEVCDYPAGPAVKCLKLFEL